MTRTEFLYRWRRRGYAADVDGDTARLLADAMGLTDGSAPSANAVDAALAEAMPLVPNGPCSGADGVRALAAQRDWFVAAFNRTSAQLATAEARVAKLERQLADAEDSLASAHMAAVSAQAQVDGLKARIATAVADEREACVRECLRIMGRHFVGSTKWEGAELCMLAIRSRTTGANDGQR